MVNLTFDYFDDIRIPKDTLDGIMHSGLEVMVRRQLDGMAGPGGGGSAYAYRFDPHVRFFGRKYMLVETDGCRMGNEFICLAAAHLLSAEEPSSGGCGLFRMFAGIPAGLRRMLGPGGDCYMMMSSSAVSTLDLRVALDAMRCLPAPFFMDCSKDPSGYYVDDPDMFSEVFRNGVYSRLSAMIGVFGKEGKLVLPYPAAISVYNVVLSLALSDDGPSGGIGVMVTNGAVEKVLAWDTLPDAELARLYLSVEPMFVNERNRIHWNRPWRRKI